MAEIKSQKNVLTEQVIIYPLWDDIIIWIITDVRMLTSSLYIQKLSFDISKIGWVIPRPKMAQFWYPRVRTLFIIIFNSKNKLVRIITSIMISLFYFQAL